MQIIELCLTLNSSCILKKISYWNNLISRDFTEIAKMANRDNLYKIQNRINTGKMGFIPFQITV